jgi:hypothetical protein
MWMEDNYMLVVQNVQVRNLKLDAGLIFRGIGQLTPPQSNLQLHLEEEKVVQKSSQPFSNMIVLLFVFLA